MDVFILFPDGRVSPVRQKQMTSISTEESHAVAVSGDFDDCQDLVKACFNDVAFRDGKTLGSEFDKLGKAYAKLSVTASALKVGAPDHAVAFCVPTEILAMCLQLGCCAMGLPVEKFVVASNRNDILTRFFATGAMQRRSVDPLLALQWTFRSPQILNACCLNC